MKFYSRLYVGKSIRNPEKVKWKLQHNAGQFSVYVIALARTEDQLDIFHCGMLKQRCYDRDQLFVAGLAGSREEAIDLVVDMMEETVRRTGEADIRKYLLQSG